MQGLGPSRPGRCWHPENAVLAAIGFLGAAIPRRGNIGDSPQPSTIPSRGRPINIRLEEETIVFKLMESASKRWRLLNGSPLLVKVIAGVRFVDGVEQTNAA
jgi:hypothetical protein